MSKIKSRYLILVILTLFILLIAIGCSTEKSNPDFVDPTAHPELVDQSWLTGKPCSLPCWQGLEPGKSSREDLLETIPNLSFLMSENGIHTFMGRDFIECKQPSEKDCLMLSYQNGTISKIDLFLNYSVNLDQVLAQLGEPDFVYIIRAGAERRDCLFRVFWLHQRLELSNRYIGKGYLPFQHDLCDQVQESGGKVPKNEAIQMVSIYSPEELDKLINILSGGTISYPWTGFSD